MWSPGRLAVVAGFAAAIGVAGWFAWPSSQPEPDLAQSPFRLQKAVQVTSATGVEEYPALSPDGRTIAYSGSPSGSWERDWDIYVTQAGGTPVNRTPDHAGRDQFPSWSPDASQIAFWSDRDGGGCYVMPAIGGAARRVAVASSFDANPPVWSQDERELSCVVGDAFRAELVTFSLDTGDALRRLDLPGRGRRMFVSTHPDGGLVAMIVSPAGLTSDLTELVVLNSATGQAERLTDGQTSVWSPVWSPDGSSLFYVSNAGGSADLWEQRLDKSGRAAGKPKAVSGGIGMRSVALSRDGKKLAYAQGRKVANLFRVPILADRQATWADAVQITFDQAFVEFADVSPDGQHLAVSSDRSGSFDLWVFPSGGGDMRQVTSDPGADLATMVSRRPDVCVLTR